MPDVRAANRNNLADALREFRKAAGLSGERLAVRCSMSQSKISRIESGQVLPSVIDVERILKALEVPSEVAAGLTALARAANVEHTSWRTYARMGLWKKQADIRALEESAGLMRYFLPAIPAGLLHTADYARQVLTPTVQGRAARDVEKMLHVRLERQTVLSDPSRRFVFLMTEQAVRWRRVELSVMAAQVAHLADLSEMPNVDIAIIPQSAEVLASPLNTFVVYDERLATVELFSGEVVLRDPRDISYHVNLFNFFLARALAGVDAANFLRSLADEFTQQCG